jgi:CRP-like cAMP-binding protein
MIVKGSVKVGMNTSNDKTLIKEIAYQSELVGENFLPGHLSRRLFAQSLTNTEAFKIPTTYFKSLLEKNPELCRILTQILIKKMSNLESRMNNFVFKKAQSRIVDFIKELALTKGLKIGLDEILINHGLSHKEIANITDTSRQTVARVLGDLKRGNIIHFSARKPHKILVRDMMNLC